MVFGQGLAAIIVFWAVVGGLGASLYLPAMQSLIHGNFDGEAQTKVCALVGASARSRPRSGLYRRVRHHAPVVASRLRARGGDHRRRPAREPDPRRALRRRGARSTASAPSCPSSAWAASCSAYRLAGRRRIRGGSSRASWAALGALVYWLVRRKREGKPTLLDPSLFASKLFGFGIFQGILQQIALGDC